jgi:hypothetical protein
LPFFFRYIFFVVYSWCCVNKEEAIKRTSA